MKLRTTALTAALIAALVGSRAAAAKDGVYKSTTVGRNGDVTVQVTIKNDKIADIQIADWSETHPIADLPSTQIPADIIKYQTTNVDIVSGATLIVNDWILAPYSYILLAMLCVYVVVFVAIVAYYAGDAKRGKKNVKTLKKLFGMFKIFTTLVFLIATAISMTGVVEAKGTGLWQWVVLCANIVVAAVQLSLKITLFVFKIVARKVGKHYTVKAQTYINGKLKEQKAKSYVMSKLYETEVTKEPERAQLAADGSVSSSAAVPQKAGREKVTRLKIDKENVKALAARAVEKLKPEDGGDNGAKK